MPTVRPILAGTIKIIRDIQVTMLTGAGTILLSKDSSPLYNLRQPALFRSPLQLYLSLFSLPTLMLASIHLVKSS